MRKLTAGEKIEILAGIILGILAGGGFVFGMFALASWSIAQR